ncbi:MAG: hypothetical protein U5L45_18185 [Saprospiraceae bacterium]|nr:hypothetical protein [Saprospiraceae bacterium]
MFEIRLETDSTDLSYGFTDFTDFTDLSYGFTDLTDFTTTDLRIMTTTFCFVKSVKSVA